MTYHLADQQVSVPTKLTRRWFSVTVRLKCLRWLNTVLAVCVYMSFAKSWQEKGCSSQAQTWQLKNILIKDSDWQVKCDVFVVSVATWTIEYNLKLSLFLRLHKICSLDFPINLHTAYYIINHHHLKLIWPNFNRRVFRWSIIQLYCNY